MVGRVIYIVHSWFNTSTTLVREKMIKEKGE
jgi:hypothetical protein